ncbi:hypothetical protein [Planococcus donghaensis]|uniref:Uncharacterized protein n=1 Tax=Planococcus donghaensis TaxID=414778 RepID=A0A1C7EE89_9BACL|nr:hypothetical protein [Planococcus donghaensis]ANU21996.1 hypothetical protein BCM40_00985 [Planococcus donghaensis]
MSITNHAIQRFQERVTEESESFIRSYICSAVKASTLLYRINGIEKWEFEGIVFIIDSKSGNTPVVRTVYLA